MDVKEGPGLGDWLLFLLLWILRCFFFNLYFVFFFLFLSVLDILKGSEVNGGVVLGVGLFGVAFFGVSVQRLVLVFFIMISVNRYEFWNYYISNEDIKWEK